MTSRLRKGDGLLGNVLTVQEFPFSWKKDKEKKIFTYDIYKVYLSIYILCVYVCIYVSVYIYICIYKNNFY